VSFETTKAMKRRMREQPGLWTKIFTGKGMDVGCGPDKLQFKDCIGFDEKDGDANKLSSYFPPESFDYLHGSHVLEHMHSPTNAIRDWLKLVKPGGYIVQTVPDWCAYERMRWPSRFNIDHKSSWSMIYKGSVAPIHVHIPSWLDGFKAEAAVVMARYVEENYNWKLSESVDQTLKVEDGVEIWNEFVLQKL
jgi:SAM-dependent methyltransferase